MLTGVNHASLPVTAHILQPFQRPRRLLPCPAGIRNIDAGFILIPQPIIIRQPERNGLLSQQECGNMLINPEGFHERLIGTLIGASGDPESPQSLIVGDEAAFLVPVTRHQQAHHVITPTRPHDPRFLSEVSTSSWLQWGIAFPPLKLISKTWLVPSLRRRRKP